jgi:hypothetical protein
MKKLIIGFALLATSSAYASGEMISKGIAVAGLGYMGYNAVKAKELKGACGTTGGMACTMMALYAAQALTDGKTAKSGKVTSQGFLGDSGDWGNTDLGNGMTGNQFDRQLAVNEENLAPILTDLNKKGLGIDPKTGMIKTPTGMKNPGQLDSGKAMAAAGLIDESQIAEADKILEADKKNRPKFKNIAMTSTAGGGYSSRGPSSAGAGYEAPAYKFNFGEKEKPNAPKTAGLVKLAGGEAIGSQSDNIFEMLHRKYQQKSSEKIFVGQEP